MVDLGGVNTGPHGSNPAFGGHCLEQGGHGVDNVVKVGLWVYPLSASVVALPHCDYLFRLLFGHIVHMTGVKRSFEKGGREDAEQKVDHQQNEHQVGILGH